MKKKALLATLLAVSVFAGGASMTGCNIKTPSGSGTTQTQTVSVTGVTINVKTLEIAVNGTSQLSAVVAPATASNKSCKWESSDPSVVAVNSSGKITGKSVGVATITVTTVDGSKTDACEVTVRSGKDNNDEVAVTGVTVTPSSLSLTVGGTDKITAKVAPTDATNQKVTWSSSDPQTVSVDGEGNVSALKAGKAKIIVTTEDGGKTAECNVTVNAQSTGDDKPDDKIAVTGVTVDPASLSLTVGGSGRITATVAPANATNQNVTWSSSDPQTVSVDGAGNVTALKAGTATITVTTEDGGKTAECIVTVKAQEVEKCTVTFKSDGVVVSTAEVSKGSTVQSYAATKDGHILEGWSTSVSGGQLYDFNTPVNGPLTLYAVWSKESPATQLSYSYAGYECAAFEWADANPDGAKLEYKLTSASAYTVADRQLVRSASATGTARADAVGLKGNANYDFRITASDNTVYNVNNMFISAYDRSGYAHFNKSDGVGAYKDDGTPKSNAKIYYVTEDNKNNVDGNGNSVVELLQKQNGGAPLIIRVVGTVGCATWKQGKITYTKTLDNTVDGKIENGKVVGNLKPEAIVDKNGNPLEQRNYDQSELKGTHNDLDTSKYSEIRGISSTIKWDSSKQEFDSCWNDASIKNANNVTVEGVGEDARIFQWG